MILNLERVAVVEGMARFPFNSGHIETTDS